MNFYDDILCEYKIEYKNQSHYIKAYSSAEATNKFMEMFNIPYKERYYIHTIYIKDVKK